MKWTDESITIAVFELKDKLGVARMPSSTEMRNNKQTGLMRAITVSGGMARWSNILGLPMKEKEKFWTDERIEKEIRKAMELFVINRMPTASELTSIGRNDLHCALSKSELKYSGWAKKLGLEMKYSETVKGNKYELMIKNRIEQISNDLFVKEMTTRHPYDLLINDCVKVDVKVASPYLLRGESIVHTFGINKKYGTCDIYICIALDENEEIERTFIIPASHLQIVTLCVGKDSKYNKYLDNWNFLYQFVRQYERAISI
ncbi:hypothetical protein ABE28_008880 [Peribacillus muralis]|uniref:Uncharacterized protein n=1 Tax=Peribacillus muralis TaxID=264697 RepID=A0A1B3XMN2_9BACI|nr:hypothetical protein [Peribacillus muralis]AOH54465.1 hypothetical protein ABE28_008880 [Peribacillus muralis]